MARRRLLTTFNLFATLTLVAGAAVLAFRFARGLGASTNLSHLNPWGLWIGFDVVAGVALAAGGYVVSTAVYIFGLRQYTPIVRPAILTGMLGYMLVVLGLLVDLGRPWRLPYPLVVQTGCTSPLFEVALCVALYLSTLLVEFAPTVCEWLGWSRCSHLLGRLTLALTILGLVLSTLHQSTLGALYLVTPTKLHPLWYSPYLPLHFFVSSVAAGLAMVICESALSHRVFHAGGALSSAQVEQLTLGLGKAAAVTLATYGAIKLVSLALDHNWSYLTTAWGGWFLLELLGFVVLPCLLFACGYRARRPATVRVAALSTVVGVVLNRLNVCLIAFNWQLPAELRYVPHWMEVVVSLSLVTAGLVMFRWIVRRMPVLH